jgi:ribonuclease D
MLTPVTGSYQKDKRKLDTRNNIYQNNITREEIEMLRLHQFDGIIHLIDSEDEINQAVDVLKKHSVIGFDTETKPNFKKGLTNRVSLIQLATPDEVFLFRINKTGITEELISLFEEEEIIKIGVAIRDDIRRVRAIRDFKPAGFLELQQYSEYFGIESNSLKKLAAIVLGFRISKSQQLTDWGGETLTEAQQRYAATDAWVSLQIYQVLRDSYHGRIYQNNS